MDLAHPLAPKIIFYTNTLLFVIQEKVVCYGGN